MGIHKPTNNFYFEGTGGKGNHSLTRALQRALDEKNWARIHLSANPKIILAKNGDEWEIKIMGENRGHFDVKYARINGKVLDLESAIEIFDEKKYSILTLKEAIDSDHFLKITKQEQGMFIEFNVED